MNELNSVTYKQLEKEAKTLGVFKQGMKKEDLFDAINEYKSQACETATEIIEPKTDVEKKYKKLTKLIRINMSSNDPDDTDKQGIFISILLSDPDFERAGFNKLIGRFVPFDRPYHVEKCLLDTLKEKYYNRQKKVSKVENGIVKEYGYKLIPTKKFLIEELDPLTEEELNAIKTRQLAEKTIGEESNELV